MLIYISESSDKKQKAKWLSLTSCWRLRVKSGVKRWKKGPQLPINSPRNNQSFILHRPTPYAEVILLLTPRLLGCLDNIQTRNPGSKIQFWKYLIFEKIYAHSIAFMLLNEFYAFESYIFSENFENWIYFWTRALVRFMNSFRTDTRCGHLQGPNRSSRDSIISFTTQGRKISKNVKIQFAER